CGGEGDHVRRAIVLPREQVPRAHVVGSRDRQPGVSRGIAVRVGRSGGAALADAPRRAHRRARRGGEPRRPLLGRAADALRRLDDVAEQALLRGTGVDDRAADEVLRRAGDGEQRRGDEPAGRALGGAQNAHTWDTVAMALGRSLVAVDLPGHGHSDGPKEGATTDPVSNAADVAVAVQALAPNALGVVGMSLGGMTSIALADAHPEL